MPIILITDSTHVSDCRELDLPGENVTVIAFDGNLELLRSVEPELVILECTCQPDHAIGMIEQIKRLRHDLPVILLAGQSSEELVIRAFKAGVRDYFRAPVPKEDLKRTILSILRLRRQTTGNRLPLQFASNSAAGGAAPDFEDLPAKILRAIRYMEANVAEPMTLDDIAGHACLSRFHFSRIFKGHVGIGPKQFILKLRINRALALLRNQDLTISSVALRSGFNELGEFTRQFRRQTGLTPSAYRHTLKPDPSHSNSK